MKKHNYLLHVLTAFFLITQPAYAGEILGHSVQASQHASQAVAQSFEGAAKLSTGVVAVPLMAVGEVGKLAGDSGEAMWDYANTPLPISDETVTVGPPPSVPFDKKGTTGKPISNGEEK